MELLVEGADFRFDRKKAHRSAAMWIEPGLHGLAHRLADGNGGVCILEAQPLGGELVDVRCEILDRPAADAGRIVIHVIGREKRILRRGAARRAVSDRRRTMME